MSKRAISKAASNNNSSIASDDDNPRVTKSAKVSAKDDQKDSANSKNMEDEEPVYKGACCCGAVKVEMSGDPQMAGYCHCYHCRAFTSAEFSTYVMSPQAKFKIVGEENLKFVNLSKLSGVDALTADEYPCDRGNCTKCGQAVLDKISGMDFISVMSFIFRDKATNELPKALAPRLHIHYKKRVMTVADGLPKYEAFPTPGQPDVGLMKDEK